MKRKLTFTLSLSILVVAPLLYLGLAEHIFSANPKPLASIKAIVDADLAKVAPQPQLTEQPIPNRLIVRFRPEFSAPLFAALQNAPNFNPTLVGNRLTADVLKQKLPMLARLFAEYKVRAADAIDPLGGTYLVRTEDGVNIAAMQEDFEASNAIVYTEFDYPVRAFTDPNDPFYQSGNQWALNQINAPQAWDITTGTNKITIAIVDSGVSSHPDLAGRILNGWNFVSDPASTDSTDDYGHGTYVAGIAAASGNNNLGIAGLDWNALVLPVKVLNQDGVGSNATIAMGIHYAADQGAQVINLSLGGTNRSQAVEEAVDYAYYPLSLPTDAVPSTRLKAINGSVLIAADANKSKPPTPTASTNTKSPQNVINKPTYPAAYDPVIAIGASNGQDEPVAASGYGPELSICAPGYSILSLSWDVLNNAPSYSYANGTSAAAPFVAGTAALMLSVNPNLNINDIRNILEGTAYYPSPVLPIGAGSNSITNPGNADKALTDPNSTVYDFDGHRYSSRLGWGRLDVFKAVQAAQLNQTFPDRRSSIEGSVTGISTKNNLNGIDPGSVVVQLTPGDSRVPDASGFFDFSNLPPGTYSLEAISSKYGVSSPAFTITVAGGDGNFDTQNLSLPNISNLIFQDKPVGAFAPVDIDSSQENSDNYIYFTQTQHSLSGSFKRYWDKFSDKALMLFGYPISEPFVENGITVQYFQRAIFQYHSEFAGTDNEILLELIGTEQSQNRQNLSVFQPITTTQALAGSDFFTQTNHSLAGDFLSYWQKNGQASIFGYPISQPFPEKQSDGQSYLVQYFQRAEMEWHPATALIPAHVELALLGQQWAQAQGLIGP